jgi:DNA invertase Pin-like site-specific DNA recombinase
MIQKLKEKEKAAIYCRIESRQPSGPSQSIEQQLRKARKQARKAGYAIAGEYADNPGAGMRHRQGAKTLLGDAGKGLFTAVIVKNEDTLARSPKLLIEVMRALREANVKVIFLNHPGKA